MFGGLFEGTAMNELIITGESLNELFGELLTAIENNKLQIKPEIF
jgi:hypothetical protein